MWTDRLVWELIGCGACLGFVAFDSIYKTFRAPALALAQLLCRVGVYFRRELTPDLGVRRGRRFCPNCGSIPPTYLHCARCGHRER